jgi:PAS domain S-box-containing protein
VSLIASREPIRSTLEAYVQNPDPETAQELEVILSNAVRVVEIIEGLAVYDPQRRLVAAAGRAVDEAPPVETPSLTDRVADGIFYQGITENGNGHTLPRAAFVANMTTPEGLFLGNLHISLSAQGLLELTDGEAGLGKSGETLVVASMEDGTPRILLRSGKGSGETWNPTPADSASDPVRLALAGKEEVYWQGTTDEDGTPVWAAVRYLPEPGWGLVLKLSAEEANEPMRAFREQARRLTLSLGAFAIVLGILLGFQFSDPILKLVGVTDQLRNGDFSIRVPVSGEDEVSLLAQTFNEMATNLEERINLLKEFQQYFQVSRDMLCIAGPDGHFKRINPAFHRTLGWTDAQFLTRPFLDFVHPDDKERTLEEMKRLSQGLPTISFENRYETPQGGYRILHWTAHPDPKTGLIYATARDITDRLRARDEAQEEIRVLKAELEALRNEKGGAA